MPNGLSFNLQYDVSTVALLDYLDSSGLHQPIDLDRAFRALAESVCPDGDINYLGRGCNQIFAWGPWLYLLVSRGDVSMFELSSGYLRSHLPSALDNNNLLLSGLSNHSRQLWWDYHYCSVYVAHLLLWLVLARRKLDETGLKGRSHFSPTSSYGGDSGIQILRTDNAFLATFSGRREYLAERGPLVEAIWTSHHGALHKGAFGPWQKAFGFNWSTPSVQLNYFGIMKVSGRSASLEPFFAPVDSLINNDELVLSYQCPRASLFAANMPTLNSSLISDVSVEADGELVPVSYAGSLVTQYGVETLLQSVPRRARIWKIRIKL